jgi:hypothetical protein
MTTEPNNTPAAPAKKESAPVSKSAKLTAADIPAAEWDKLVAATGTSVTAVGKTIRAVAAFCQTHSALSARSMADYMSAHYTSGALSHTTIAQHKRLDATLTEAVDSAMLSDELYGKARSLFAAASYGWERWEAALKWESVTASTHEGERSALAVRLITETYSAAQSDVAIAAAETAKAAEREAAKAKREEAAETAKQERAAELEAATGALREELEALKATAVTAGEPGSWEALTRLLGDFLPHAADMPRHTGAALAALMAAAGNNSPGDVGAKHGAAPARKPQSKSKPLPVAA